MIEFTDWAEEVIAKAHAAATRLNPDARIRLTKAGSGLQPLLVDGPEPGDEKVTLRGFSFYVASEVAGLVDIESPHDRIVLRPAGSSPNERE